ncbi:hypothetical protein V1J52_15820 [Streptomyces sp. TRM 70351]|uniref:hypothetical protein n=1 Tax=Streptomyces sp. TRM 70351 TaxID=3116552 RepID=UPI002E7B2848|nr:hypothetical protein [Streptomyces sp. TRM 70351]MEE1929634.1 hypothetical protein [Streptomyces sp. TRM 70351]
MGETTDTTSGSPATRLPDVVQETAAEIARLLIAERTAAEDGRGPSGTGADARDPDDPLLVAAFRVLGADALAPALLRGLPVPTADLALAQAARAAYVPAADTAPVTAWSHWGLCAALDRVGGGGLAPQPDAAWVAREPWTSLAHPLARLSALALPGVHCALREEAARRPVDLARSFVRAVRRRDWPQAAGAARWLALLPGVPPTLGLDAGLAFVEQLGGADARVLLQVRAARLLRAARDDGAPGGGFPDGGPPDGGPAAARSRA